MDPAGNSLQSLRLYLICPDSLMIFQAEKYRSDPFHFFYSDQLVIVAIQNNVSIFSEKIKNFCLSF